MNRMEAMRRAVESEHCLRPAEAFSLVGDETRLRILEALWGVDEPAAFSTLYELADADNSAGFNYHLGQLTGHFIRKTEAGYELRTAGKNVVRAIVAGSFNAHPRLAAFDTGDDCTQCGEPLLASYDDEKLAIDCPACGVAHGSYAFPPGGLLGRDDDEILAAFDQRVRRLHGLAADGVCPECSGRMRTQIRSEGDCCLDVELRTEHVCEQCRHSLCSMVGLALLDQPAVVAFYRDHGVDIGATPYWQLEWCVTDEQTVVQSADPWRIEITMEQDAETLSVVVDGELNLVESHRRTVSEDSDSASEPLPANLSDDRSTDSK